jgi:hypothetical protein
MKERSVGSFGWDTQFSEIVIVMPGLVRLVPANHDFNFSNKTWMPGTSPGMTKE